MPDTYEELQERLELLGDEKVKSDESIMNINGLLAKADKRRRTEGGNTRKWDSVLENLENSLDEVKARREAARVDYEQTRRRIAELEEEGLAEQEAIEAAEVDSAQNNMIADSSKSAAKQILSMSLDELSKLNLEEVAMLHQQIGVDISDDLLVGDSKVTARMELANQSINNSESEESAERRRQRLLRTAIEKILKNDIKELSEEEIQVTLICHALLRRRVNPSIRDERLVRVLGGFVKMLRKDKPAPKNSAKK